MDLVTLIAEAIATMEGWYIPGSRARRNNNPGNLRSWGSNPIEGGYAQFPSADAGWAALRRQVQLNINRGLTLEEFFGGKTGVYGGYAPSADRNDPDGYARFVAQKTGIPLGTPIGQTGAPSTSPPLSQLAQHFPSRASEILERDTMMYAAVAVAAVSLAWIMLGD